MKGSKFLLPLVALVGGLLMWKVGGTSERVEVVESSVAEAEKWASGQRENWAADRRRRHVTMIVSESTAEGLNSPDGTTETDINLIHVLLSLHCQAFGSNPLGENDEVTASLIGGNAKGVAVLSPNHPAISPAGELLDRWGRPYFFHAISATSMEIRSAGPDRDLYTLDDVVRRQ